MLSRVSANISMKIDREDVNIDDTILAGDEIYQIHIATKRNHDFVNSANKDFVRHAINHSKFDRQNIKWHYEKNLSVMI
jgi:hypothetical protein